MNLSPELGEYSQSITKFVSTALRAYIVLKPGFEGTEQLAEELKNYVKSRLAPFKYPRWIGFVKELPKTATGNIQRFKLRAGILS